MFVEDGHMWFGGGFMWLIWIFLLVAVVFVFKFMSDAQSKSSSDKSPLSILKERYAKGEINEEEFERRKKALTQD